MESDEEHKKADCNLPLTLFENIENLYKYFRILLLCVCVCLFVYFDNVSKKISSGTWETFFLSLRIFIEGDCSFTSYKFMCLINVLLSLLKMSLNCTHTYILLLSHTSTHTLFKCGFSQYTNRHGNSHKIVWVELVLWKMQVSGCVYTHTHTHRCVYYYIYIICSRHARVCNQALN